MRVTASHCQSSTLVVIMELFHIKQDKQPQTQPEEGGGGGREGKA